MKYSVIWSAFSEKQIDVIFEFYSKTVSIKIAKKIVKEILLAPEYLVQNPKMGSKEILLENREIEYRYIIVGNHKIIYSVDEQNCKIKIADVFDTRQNPIKINKEK